MDTEKTPPVEEKGRTLTVDDIVKALRENGITPISVYTDGPECVDFAYQDNYYIVVPAEALFREGCENSA